MKQKQTFKQVIDNNLFVLKICFSAAPLYIIAYILEMVRNEVFIFIEHIYGIGFVLESIEFGRPFRDVAIFLIVLFILICLGMVFNAWMYQSIAQKGLPKMKQKFKSMLYEKAQELDLECYDNPEYYNEFVLAVSEADKQVDRMMDFLSKLFGGITVFVTTGAFFLIKDSVSVIFVVFSFICSFVFIQISNKINYGIRLEKNPYERKRSYINRVFYLNDYAKELRLNPDVSNKLFEQFNEANDEIYKIDKANAKRKFIITFVKDYLCNDFISDVLYIIYLVYKAVVIRAVSYSSVVILFNSFGNLKRSLRIVTEVYPYASETSLYVDKIRNFLNYKPEIFSKKKLQVPKEPKKIEFSNVCFAYKEEEGNIINNLSITINPCEKIALVGYNGAGKTTLIKLLMRLYDTKSGTILLDGIDVKEYDVEQYRNYIGTVFQDYNMYAATVKENVLMDNADEAAEDEIMESLVKSGFGERLLSLKNGINTPVTAEFEDNGVNLSGGEAQKVAISRAFYKDSGLIILDEPSSALDPIAEYQLNHSMLEATENKTVIFISHRLSTTRLADKIFMLENGNIIEVGSHDELLKLNGKYAEMWRVQAGQYLAV
ncbi:ABC transporter ATP-binding protein [Clostridium chromiireducens]|uniref:Lipid A export ATP-binding/permease protein MsbA n=1 Tax=Clostridium chromiireducens TaxID=225345 RepID=A0A1V4J1X3_9CLOT|nr:ABC transporter ATP-binding protein [Clostridium chromiireducens]OPJ66090.1 lipid A export ATP-binding/permease protein MsbA [Clostridium chromiireducens]